MDQRAAAVIRSLPLALWGVVLVVSSLDGRLDLLLRSIFHPLVAINGALLLTWALQQALHGSTRPLKRPWTSWLSSALAVLMVLVPPNPSFSDLAANRPREAVEDPSLMFVLPPSERSLTDWVRLLRTQPDPSLYEGDPVRITGFVLMQEGDRPHLARLLVRCCLADATPVGLPVRWPAHWQPRPDSWLTISGRMGVEDHNGLVRTVVIAEHVRQIPRPSRPLEP